ncbi:MAG TPA: glycosyltransferase [Opitutaceae bacterium]|nr:glycosyltransferase [Opitutaceae bacterium]
MHYTIRRIMPNNSLRIIADLNWFGHIPTYHRLYLRAFLDNGHRVVSLSPRPDLICADKNLSAALETGQLQVPAEGFGAATPPGHRLARWLDNLPGSSLCWNLLRNSTQIRQWRARKRWMTLMTAANKYAEAADPDTLLFIPYLDDLLHCPTSAKVSAPRWAGLYLDSSQLRRPIGAALRESLALFNDPKLQYLAVLDEGSIGPLRIHGQTIRIGAVPDITDERISLGLTELAHAVLNCAKGRPIISLIGHLTPRKGIRRLIKLAQNCDPQRFFFLFAGQIESLQVDSKTRTFLLAAEQKRHANVYAHLKRLPDETDFNALVKISNVIYLRYENFYGSSNLLTKAAVFRRPVIVTDEGCIAERVRLYRTGAVFSGGDEQTELNAIDHLAHRLPADWEHLCTRYHRLHNYESLVARLREIESPTKL